MQGGMQRCTSFRTKLPAECRKLLRLLHARQITTVCEPPADMPVCDRTHCFNISVDVFCRHAGGTTWQAQTKLSAAAVLRSSTVIKFASTTPQVFAVSPAVGNKGPATWSHRSIGAGWGDVPRPHKCLSYQDMQSCDATRSVHCHPAMSSSCSCTARL